MLKDIILGFKLVKYGYKLKENIFMLAIFFPIGIFVEIQYKGTNIIGGLYVMLIGMWSFQVIMSVDVSEYIQSSAMKRKLQLTIPVITSTVLYLFIFTVILVEKSILINMYPDNQEPLFMSLVQLELFMLMVFVFSSICYKYFFWGLLVFIALEMGVIITTSVLFNTPLASKVLSIPFGVFGLIGYLVIFLGAAIEYFVGTILYDKPLSQFAFKGLLKD